MFVRFSPYEQDLRSESHRLSRPYAAEASNSPTMTTHNINECFNCGFQMPRAARLPFTLHCRQHLPNQTCSTCGLDLANLSIYHKHPKPHSCYVCGRDYVVKDAIFKHHYQTHELVDLQSLEEQVVCFTCDSVLQKQSLKIHRCIRRALGKRIEEHCCHVCGEKFEWKKLLSVHASLHQAESIRRKQLQSDNERRQLLASSLECKTCCARFDNREVFQEHIDGKNGDKICYCCCKRLPTKQGLFLHYVKAKLRQQAFVCFVCHSRFNEKQQIVAHSCIRLLAPKPFICFICSKGFFKKPVLSTHILIHSSPSVHCADCRYSATDKSRLLRHIFNVHLRMPSGNRNICSVCSKEFCTSSSMWRHYRGIHLKHRPVECFDCGLGSASKMDFHRHQLAMHLKLRLYTCYKCCRSFAAKCDFMRHVRDVGLTCERIARLNKMK